MSKKMLINASHSEENRVAIVVDGVLSELDIEIAGQEQTKGNIYKAVVVRVESGLQAAFVDYGAEKMGFLQIGEIHPSLYPGDENPDPKNRPRINDILHRGQEILIQIVKEERGTKGAALTTFLSLPGRYMVLMPDSKTKGVSRKITVESERKQLKRTMAELDLPERMGYIVRTAGIGKEQEELKRDFDYLVKVYQGILNHKEQVKAPAQLYQESNLVIRSIRDYFSSEMDEVLIDDNKVYQDAKDFFELVMPEQSKLVKQHRERRPIFSRYQIEEQIDGLSRNQIPLPSGGSIVIDQTEALVAIDVNSGKMSSESGIEATAGKTNLEAAAEVGRQLRLRDLGGLIVIDFIDMRDRKRIREVEQTLRNSLRDDKAKVTIGRISQFGLLEMSRQRIKAALSVGAYLECPHCLGKGRIKSVEAQAVSFLRQAHASSSKGHIGKIEARTPLDVATYLLNEKRAALNDLEKQLNLTITIEGRPDFVPGQVELELHKREKQAEQGKAPSPISHANQIEDALAAAKQETTEEQPGEETQPATETADTSEESTGRKRRRRRRKRSRKETGEQQTPVESSEEGTKEETAPPALEAAKEEPAAETAEKKPRARRSPRKTTAKKDQAETQEAAVEKAVETESKPEEKPKRRSPRKSAAKKAMEKAATESTPAEKTETEKAEEATKPKRRTTRKPAAKKEAEKQAPEATTPEAQDAKPSEDKTEAAEKPKRRTARKTPAKKAVEKATEPTATEEQPAPPSAPEEETAEAKPKRKAPAKAKKAATTPAEEEAKPKRRTTRSKKATSDETTASKASETQSTEQTEKATEEKPKKRSTARKTVKKDAAAAKSEAKAKATDTPAETEEKPKRTRRKAAPKKEVESESTAETATADKPKRRAPRKKAEPAQAAEATAAPQETAEEAPKRRTRKTAAKKAEEAAGTKEAEAAEAKPKRRAPRKKSEPAQATESASTPKEATEEAPKRRTRKTTAKKAEEAAGTKEADSAEAKPKRRAPRKNTSAKAEAGDADK